MSKTTKTLLFVVIVVLGAIAYQSFSPTHTAFATSVCAENLREIDDAKKEWALKDHGTNTVPSEADLLPLLGGLRPGVGYHANRFPHCPSGGTYDLGAIGETPTCSLGGVDHRLPSK